MTHSSWDKLGHRLTVLFLHYQLKDGKEATRINVLFSKSYMKEQWSVPFTDKTGLKFGKVLKKSKMIPNIWALVTDKSTCHSNIL